MTIARQLANALADLLRREHHALADFLVALAAFDAEQRWVDLGHNSLFNFLVRDLGLSKGAAFYRNRAAELVRKFPEVVEPIRDGRLCLSSVAELSNVLTRENLAEVLPRFFHLSRAEAKEITAELKPDPAPPIRSVVTTVPSPAAPFVAAAPAPGFLENLVHANSRVPDVAPPPAPRPTRVQVDPLTAELRRIHLTSDRELLDLLARARDALSHSHPGASDDAVIKVGLRLVIDRHRKRRGIGAKPRVKTPGHALPVSPETTPSVPAPAPAAAETSGDRPAPPAPVRSPSPPPPRGRSRYAPPEVWREVWIRDDGRCAWPLEGGGVCGSTNRIQLDHIDGFALGADTTAAKCRLTCHFHNDLNARRVYGSALMNRYTRPKGPRCSEPVAVYGAAVCDDLSANVPARGRDRGLRYATGSGARMSNPSSPCAARSATSTAAGVSPRANRNPR
jgi:hypothetical protein